MHFDATSEVCGDKLVFSLSGRFDILAYEQFKDLCRTALKEERISKIELDFKRVEYMDGSALWMLLVFKQQTSEANIHKITLKNCSDTILTILEVAHFHKMFTIDGLIKRPSQSNPVWE